MALKWIAVTLVALLLLVPLTVEGDEALSEEEDEEEPGIVEIVFSFDTTGSMYPVIGKVRQVVSDMIHRLQSDIPGIRIAVFAHGDWQDAKKTYATSWVDFTTDVDRLQNFVTGVQRTSGGDLPEAYELVLHQVSRELSWSHGSRRSLVMIGDNVPHEADYYANIKNISWRNEADILKAMGCRVYAIRALDYNSETFYRTVARKTDGVYLRLDDFSSIIKFIMAISYREHGLEYLEDYEEEVRKEGMTPELENLFRSLKQHPVRRSTRAQIDPTKSPSATTLAPSTTPAADVEESPSNTEVYQLYIESDISYRFATTSITSKLANKLNVSTEATFNVVLPKAAFISNFTMIINDIAYAGEVKEKEAAKKTYERAKKRGESAGHVAAVPRDTNRFKVSVNIASESKVTFVLVYQELLARRLGVYSHVIHIDPGQVVKDLQVVVNLHESREIDYLHVPEKHGQLLNEVRSHTDNPYAVITRPAPNKARIAYRPTPEQQKDRIAGNLHGQFVVEYDVIRTKDAGELQIVDGYFVHYIAPDGLPPSPKSIMFVLDTSGSMYNRKLAQLKDAMKSILAELRPDDYFNVMGFADIFKFWQHDGLVQATPENKRDAKRWVRRIRATGGTNIDVALTKGMEMLQRQAASNTSLPSTSLLVFLTDGMPTVGVTDTARIQENARNHNQQRFTLFSLGFGQGVNFNFLTKLSLQNNGFARKIYEDSDADLQLRGFYTEIGTPTLSEVEVTYLDDQVDNTTVTQTSYTTYFDGSEIIIAGHLKDPSTAVLNAQVEANSVGGSWSHSVESIAVDEESDEAPSTAGLRNKMERMWAYLTIKSLLKKSIETTSPTEKEDLKRQALDLSLKYHFVTPLTSMVVVKPEEEDVEDVEDPDAPKDAAPTAKPGVSSKSVDSSGVHSYHPTGIKTRDPTRPMSRTSGSGGSRSFADSDPHFIVNIRGSETPICFDVMGIPGQIFNLVHDRKQDVMVNGLIVGKKVNRIDPRNKKDKPRTYFGKIAIYHRNISLVITPLKIRYGKRDIQWKTKTTIQSGHLTLTLVAKNKVRVSIGEDADFIIMRHLVREDHPVKVSFLGFYVENDRGLSEEAHGLLGQFKQLLISVNKDILSVKPKSTATLHFNSTSYRPEIKVTAGHRENLSTKEVMPCWFVHNNGRRLLDGRHLDYLVPHIAYRKAPPGLRKKDIIPDTL